METSVETHITSLQRGDYKTIRELLFKHLRHLIISGQFEPGQKLVEEDLAARFKVSRTPVREAIRKLEIEGLVQYQPRRGVVVTGFSAEDIDEIYATREVLEGLAARLAAAHATEGEVQELGRHLDQMNRAAAQGDVERSAQIHTRFNGLLYRMGRNRRLLAMLTQLSEYIEHGKLVSLGRAGRAHEIRAEHEAMFEAIARRDPDAAEQAARLHVANARRAFFGQTRLPPGTEARGSAPAGAAPQERGPGRNAVPIP
jgi:DNA-binding GntR family transcriptional regulator